MANPANVTKELVHFLIEVDSRETACGLERGTVAQSHDMNDVTCEACPTAYHAWTVEQEELRKQRAEASRKALEDAKAKADLEAAKDRVLMKLVEADKAQD